MGKCVKAIPNLGQQETLGDHIESIRRIAIPAFEPRQTKGLVDRFYMHQSE